MKMKGRHAALLLILGLLLSLQVRAAKQASDHVPLSEIQEYQTALAREAAELEQLRLEALGMRERIAAYEEAQEETGDIRSVLLDDLEQARHIAGITSLEGPGVIVIITDGDRELEAYENPNTVIVHNMDVQALVDDLRLAGAEAISVNGQRVIYGRTEIQCTGPTIRVNDEVYAQPFIIKAIGNRRHLEAALNAPGTYGQVLRQYGVFLEVYTSVNLEVPAFKGSLETDYLKQVEEGEDQ